MKNINPTKVALCWVSLTCIQTITSLVKERRERKDVVSKQNQAIDILRQQVESIGFAAETTENGMIYLVNRQQPYMGFSFCARFTCPFMRRVIIMNTLLFAWLVLIYCKVNKKGK